MLKNICDVQQLLMKLKLINTRNGGKGQVKSSAACRDADKMKHYYYFDEKISHRNGFAKNNFTTLLLSTWRLFYAAKFRQCFSRTSNMKRRKLKTHISLLNQADLLLPI